MKPEELRIGNWVCDEHGGEDQVISIENNHMQREISEYATIDLKYYGTINIKDIYPIPLTPEWLERLGFGVGEGPNYKIFMRDRLMIEWSPQLGYYFEWEDDEDYRKTSIQHVHQLQNLYFALTGEEL